MAPILAFRPTMTTDGAPADASDRAVCPRCHTVDPSMTLTAVAAGAAWKCTRCAQRWDVDRLATVANYTAWEAARASLSPLAVPPSIAPAAEPRGTL
jgi:hypothetical protein